MSWNIFIYAFSVPYYKLHVLYSSFSFLHKTATTAYALILKSPFHLRTHHDYLNEPLSLISFWFLTFWFLAIGKVLETLAGIHGPPSWAPFNLEGSSSPKVHTFFYNQFYCLSWARPVYSYLHVFTPPFLAATPSSRTCPSTPSLDKPLQGSLPLLQWSFPAPTHFCPLSSPWSGLAFRVLLVVSWPSTKIYSELTRLL